MGKKWTVSQGPDPDRGEPFLVIEAHDTGMVSMYQLKPGPVFVTPDIIENVRTKLGAAVVTVSDQRPTP